VATYQILSWHGIPLQVRAKDGSGRCSWLLAGRFQEAADAAAMLAGLTNADAYVEGLTWSDRANRDGSAEDVAQAVAAELEAAYPTVDARAVAQRIRRQAGDEPS
jgi:hypothetical protein